MNIVFNQSQQINLQDSSFSDNTALEGGALYFQNIQDQIQLKNTTFKNNVAYANGGAIFFDGIKNIFLDQLTSIKQNTALIGGGIRIKGVQNFQLINKGIVDQNKAEIFGDNIATYPSQVQIQSFSQQKEQFSFKSDINLKKIWIDNFKSGGSLDFDIFFMDDNGKHLNFSTNSLKQGIYPKIIQNEIQYWNAHLIVFNTSFVQLVGESSVNYNSFNETTKSFPFKTLYINSLPQTTQFLTLQYQLVDYIQPNQISIEINFRNCKAGEVDHILNDQIRSCLSCDVGHYSMYNYSQSYNQSEIICKQCPQQSQVCEFDHFVLKQGFWRTSNLSDQIFQCTKYQESCDEFKSNSLYGCIEGYVGPLCEQCDYSGIVWLNRYSENSSKSYCQKCSPTANQITVLIISTSMIITYLFLQIQFIVLNLNLYLKCNYVRLMNLLPISVSQYKNINTFYVKCLMNYLQIQLILIGQIDQIPQFISFLPNTIGQPSSITTIGSLCLVPSEVIDKNGQGRTKLVISQFYNLIIVLIMIVLILITEYSKKNQINQKKHYFRYNALYFLYTFMQPDSVSLIAKFLTCRNIGDQSYFTEDLQIKCNEYEYLQFQYYIGIPLLIFWISLPAFFLFKLIKISTNLRNPSVIFCYGYFFIEYKQKKYYWEFIRIYTKVVIVLFFTLFNGDKQLSYLIVIIVMVSYLLYLNQSNPFLNNKMMKMERLCYFNLIFLIILQNLKNIVEQEFIVNLIMSLIYFYFILRIISIILYHKLFSKSNALGRAFLLILSKILSQKNFDKVQKRVEVSLKAFYQWKKIKNSLKFLISQPALDKINQKISKKNSFLRIQFANNTQLQTNNNNNNPITSPILNFSDQNRLEDIQNSPFMLMCSPLNSYTSPRNELLLSQNGKKIIQNQQSQKNNDDHNIDFDKIYINFDEMISINSEQNIQQQSQGLQFQDQLIIQTLNNLNQKKVSSKQSQ